MVGGAMVVHAGVGGAIKWWVMLWWVVLWWVVLGWVVRWWFVLGGWCWVDDSGLGH